VKNNKENYKELISDKELFSAINKGDHEAFQRFFESYKKRVAGFLYKRLRSSEDVEELVQVVFMKVWENRAVINHELSPNAYLFTIAKNCALDTLRQKARKLLFEKHLIDNFKVATDGEASLIDEDLKRYVNELITHIPERRREIFKLRYENQLSYKEISEKLGISENTVHSQIGHALNYLRKKLGEELWTVTLLLVTFFSVLKV